MKRTYLAKRNALFSSANFSYGAYALTLVVCILFLRLLAPNFFWSMFAPVFRTADTFSERSNAILNGFKDTAELALKNEKLKNENTALALQNYSLLKKIESLSGLQPFGKGIVAGVMVRPPTSPYDTLALSAGSKDGITLGMGVFGEGNVPLGVISAVHENFSRATLFSAPEMSINGWVGRSSVPITINGAGAGVMNASAPRSADISAGDIVYVPGPGMLPIGNVARVDSDSSSPSVTLRIMPALNLFSVAWVSIRDTGISLP